MDIEHTQFPVPGGAGRSLSMLHLQDLKKRIPAKAIRFIKQWVQLDKDPRIKIIGHPALNGQLKSPSIPEDKEACQVILIDMNSLDEVEPFSQQLPGLNAHLQFNGCLVACVRPVWKNKRKQLRHQKKYAAQFKAGHSWKFPDVETCGRLFACGFCLLEVFESPGEIVFVARKAHPMDGEPKADRGPLIRLKRVGKNGKRITVYKFRTMYPYSEYIQEYIYERHGLQDGGKMNGDPRVTPLGRALRKYWIDELPMLLNLLKGDLKLFGVRPLTEHYLSLYPEAYQKYRNRFKPGLIPPFYADLPKSLEDIVDSEKEYLSAYERQPFRTDWLYFWRAINNIVLGGVRSG